MGKDFSDNTGLVRGMNPYAEEAEIKIPSRYIITFLMRDGSALTLPYKDEEAVDTIMRGLSLKIGGFVTIPSDEPALSVISLNDLIMATPSLASKEGL